MCGRVKLATDVSEIKSKFRIPPEYPTPNFPPSWNVAPPSRCIASRRRGLRALDALPIDDVAIGDVPVTAGFSDEEFLKPTGRSVFAGYADRFIELIEQMGDQGDDLTSDMIEPVAKLCPAGGTAVDKLRAGSFHHPLPFGLM